MTGLHIVTERISAKSVKFCLFIGLLNCTLTKKVADSLVKYPFVLFLKLLCFSF